MPDNGSRPEDITVGHLIAAISRAEHWLKVVREGLAALPEGTRIDLPGDAGDAAEALKALQPNIFAC